MKITNEECVNLSGCDHYKRKASLVAPCCGVVYPCRVCHDAVAGHQMKRAEVSSIVCRECRHRQPVAADCRQCGIKFAQYFCAECRLFDDEPRQQFHCEECGICRAGGRDNFFHCSVCDLCLPLAMQGNHKCIWRVGRSDCSVCLEDLHSSRTGARALPCGHMIHPPCFTQLVKHGITTCPECNLSLFDMSETWAAIDQRVSLVKVPSEYRDCFVNVLCRDCQAHTEVRYHLVGLKCGKCGSYNTTRGAGPLVKRSSPARGTTQLLACFPTMPSLRKMITGSRASQTASS